MAHVAWEPAPGLRSSNDSVPYRRFPPTASLLRDNGCSVRQESEERGHEENSKAELAVVRLVLEELVRCPWVLLVELLG